MATIEERIKELNELYAKAKNPDDLRLVWELSRKLDMDLQAAGWMVSERAKAVLSGCWARYHELLKFGGTPEIEELYRTVRYYYLFCGKKDIETVVNYGYLFSEINSQLWNDPEGAGKINDEISQLVKHTDNVPIAFKVVNALGSNAMQQKNWQKAIDIFDAGVKEFPEAQDIPAAWQHLANILSQRGLAKLNLSDDLIPGGTKVERLDFISSAIVDLRGAEELYMKVMPPPLKHLPGIQNRLIMAAIRLLNNENTDRPVKIGHEIQSAFSAKNQTEAKRIIAGLRQIEAKAWNRIEGEVSGSIWAFIQSIQLGLQIAEEFLAQHSEEGK